SGGDPSVLLCGDGRRVGGRDLLTLVIIGLGADVLGGSKDFEVHVSAALDPFVVLLGQDRPDQADEGVTVGEDPDHVGTSADLSVQPLGGVVGPDLTPGLLRERGECKYLLP